MTHAAAVGREQRERVRAEVRGRYREYLAGVFADRGVADAAELAGAAILQSGQPDARQRTCHGGTVLSGQAQVGSQAKADVAGH